VRIGRRQDVEQHGVSAADSHQPCHLVATGHDRQAARTSRQQRTYLVSVAGVVQDASTRRPVSRAATQRRSSTDVGRQASRFHPERLEKFA
jgi:hypothetical protein